MDRVAVKPSGKRWRFWQFSLRTLLIVTLVAGGGLGWIARARRQSQAREAAVKSIELSKGFVIYQAEAESNTSSRPALRPAFSAFQTGPSAIGGATSPEIAAPKWLRSLIGDFYFLPVHSIELTKATDGDLKLLDDLPELQEVVLNSSAQWIHTKVQPADADRPGEQVDRKTAATSATTISVLTKTINITDAGLAHLGRLRNLRRLELSRTDISDSGLEFIRDCNRLESLNLCGTQVQGVGLRHFDKLRNLIVLDLSQTPLTSESLRHLSALAGLRQLRLRETKIDDDGLESLSGLPLEILSLQRTRIGDAGLAHLQSLTALKELDLAYTRISDAGLVHLEKMPWLETVFVGDTLVTNAGTERLRAALPNLKLRLLK